MGGKGLAEISDLFSGKQKEESKIIPNDLRHFPFLFHLVT